MREGRFERVMIAALAAGCQGGGQQRTADDATVADGAVESDAATIADGGIADGAVASDAAPDPAVDAAAASCGFEGAPVAWTLPPGAGTNGFGSFAGTNLDGTFGTVDLDGDGRLDLVWTYRDDDATVGTSRWLVHRGIDGGFAADTTAWPLPGGDGPFRTPWYVDTIFPSYDLLDVDGDARPDLVVSYRGGGGPVGTTRWDVYLNQGAGFATSSIAWALPPGHAASTFRSVRRSWQATPCPDLPAYETFDLDGDARLDLVITDECAGGRPTRWLVHRGVAGGFAAVPAAWDLPLPDGFEYCIYPYDLLLRDHLDLDGDRRPDLVTTASCTDGEIGHAHWLVHHNTGDGFAASGQSWALPGGPSYLHALAHRDEPSHVIVDLDADARPDLVLLSRAGTDLGTARWQVHRNTGDGFAAAEDWCLPDGYGEAAFATTPHEGCMVLHDTPAWALFDLDDDGTPGLVIANDRCDPTSTAGTERWWVHGD